MTSKVLQQLRTALLRQGAGSLTDGQLLECFLAQRDEAAFTALVRRHGPMVLGVCRRIIGNVHDADDAFQATFLVLVRKAASLRQRELLGNWLYGVAYRTAMKARALNRRAARRTDAVGRQVADKLERTMSQDQLDPADLWQELQPLLDQELNRMPDKYRVPVVLCELEGQTRKAVAQQLGIPEGTLSSRLATARKLLANRLTRRGGTLSAGSLAMMLSQSAASASVPASLLTSTVKAVCLLAAGPVAAGVISTKVATLTQGVMKAMLLSKLKITTAVLFLAGIAGTGVGVATYHSLGPEQQTTEEQDTTKRQGNVSEEPQPLKKQGTFGAAQSQADELLQEALQALNASTGSRHRTLADIAVLQMKLGKRGAALKTFDQARQLIDQIPENGKYWGWRELATAYGRAGEMTEALALAMSIPDHVSNYRGQDKEFRAMVLEEVAIALAEAGHGQEASRVMESLKEQSKTRGSWVLPKLALAQAQAGKIKEALQTVNTIPDDRWKVMALAGFVYGNRSFGDYPHELGIAWIQAQAGDKAGAQKTLDKAVAIAKTLPDGQGAASAWAAIACTQVRIGNIEAARATARLIGVESWKNLALVAIAKAQAAAGQTKEALQTTQPIQSEAERIHALYQLAVGQARAKNLQAARETFKQAADLVNSLPEADRGFHNHNLASAQAAAGDFSGAVQTAMSRMPPSETTLCNIAYEQALAGDIRGALQTAEAIQDSDFWKGSTLYGIARAQTERGDAEGALAWANQLASSHDKAHALFGVAEGLVKRAASGK
jgi:RNA polymerase sigma factor (sigma-70 family)